MFGLRPLKIVKTVSIIIIIYFVFLWFSVMLSNRWFRASDDSGAHSPFFVCFITIILECFSFSFKNAVVFLFRMTRLRMIIRAQGYTIEKSFYLLAWLMFWRNDNKWYYCCFLCETVFWCYAKRKIETEPIGNVFFFFFF